MALAVENVHHLRSGHSSRHYYVRFINLAPKRVDVIWINHEGSGVTYKSLGPREHYDVQTFVSHPWIFRDSVNHDKMSVFSTESRYPRSVFTPKEESSPPANQRPMRKLVFITLPVYSLKERCFQIMRDQNVNSSNIAELYIPKSLKEDYLYFLRNGHTF